MNGLGNLIETYREHSLVRTNELIRFWRSKVKVAAGSRGGVDIHVDATASKSTSFFFQLVILSEKIASVEFSSVPSKRQIFLLIVCSSERLQSKELHFAHHSVFLHFV